jgi:hypothetical protein
LAEPFVVSKEKRAVLEDAPSSGRSELVLPQSILGEIIGVGEEVGRIEFIVAEEIECASVEGVGAGASDGIDHSAGGEAVLGE